MIRVGSMCSGYEEEITPLDINDPWVFQRVLEDAKGWRTTGATGAYSYEEVWERTGYRRQVILPPKSA